MRPKAIHQIGDSYEDFIMENDNHDIDYRPWESECTRSIYEIIKCECNIIHGSKNRKFYN